MERLSANESLPRPPEGSETIEDFLRKEKRIIRQQERQPLKRKIAITFFLAISLLPMEGKGRAFESAHQVVATSVSEVRNEKDIADYQLNWLQRDVQNSWEQLLLAQRIKVQRGEVRQSPLGKSEQYGNYIDAKGNTIYEQVQVKDAARQINGATISEITALRDRNGNLVAIFASGRKRFIPFSRYFINPRELNDDERVQIERYFDEIKIRAQESERQARAK